MQTCQLTTIIKAKGEVARQPRGAISGSLALATRTHAAVTAEVVTVTVTVVVVVVVVVAKVVVKVVVIRTSTTTLERPTKQTRHARNKRDTNRCVDVALGGSDKRARRQ